MTRTWQNQFPSGYRVPATLVDLLARRGWEDTSWGNDVCPSFERSGLRLWADAANNDLREMCGARFTVMRGEQVVYKCEELRDIIKWLNDDEDTNTVLKIVMGLSHEARARIVAVIAELEENKS